MKNFVSLFEDYNIEKWEKKDPPFPDFLIYKGTYIIGVEHTSLICDQLMKIRNAQKKCFTLAMEIAQTNNLLPLDVQAKFISNSKVINIQDSAKELYDFVVNSLPSIPKKYYFDIKPKNLQYFNMIRIRRSDFHDWSELKIVWSEINPIEKIKNTVEGKEEKLSEYLKYCDICWLLIGVDEFNAPEAIKITNDLNFKFDSNFDRVFVLHNYEGRYVELKKKYT